jgi:hypothetical protein
MFNPSQLERRRCSRLLPQWHAALSRTPTQNIQHKELIMKQKQQSVVLAGMLAIAVCLSGCEHFRGDQGSSSSGGAMSGGAMSSGASQGGSLGTAGTDAPNTPGSNPNISGGSGSSGTTGSSGTMGDSGMTGGGAQGGAAMGQGSPAQGGSAMGQGTGASMAPNSTVVAIEVMPAGASDAATAGATGSTGATGATGAGGATGAAQVYVITLQMDDGSTKKVTQDAVPDFRSGDRVNITDGMIHR